ncbi:proprotein convertase subtilisin/kexin type 7 isoform X1 [Hydra vulgaris]|uniref:proprotein convertase subtilisin/kexin type 7 isoform X1 n=1 Tax=Hydra vulgaris TaxID=6087 RepID=UPI001F5E49DA|nr:proprotein convertase subtilisin/kexin type 7 [Hydra vulgaris]
MPLTKLWERITSCWKLNFTKKILLNSVKTSIIFLLLLNMVSYSIAYKNVTIKIDKVVEINNSINIFLKQKPFPTGDHQQSFRSVKNIANIENSSYNNYLDNYVHKLSFLRDPNKKDSVSIEKKSKNSPLKELSSSWAIRLLTELDNEKTVSKIAQDLGLISHGNIGHLPGHYLLVHHTFYNHSPVVERRIKNLRSSITSSLRNHPHVHWVRHEEVLKRYKRSLQFKDQFFPSQWHLDNLKFIGHDINVTGVWENNITGKGVTVSVIDDGVEWTNPDILDNYSAQGSWDLNSNDGDPMPRVDEAGLNHHGTRCAGEIAAVANEYCGVGVAFGAKVSGIRILDGPMTDSLEAMAFNTKSEVNDVYSCSWGPDDNGRTVDGPHQLAQAALAHGVMFGRKGFGSIFVVASGNGGHFKDNCNFDGYANSIFTVTIGAVDELGQMPYYAEQCAAMLAVTYSSGQGHQRNIVTTDWRLGTGTGCTDRHTGTSAAAPLAAGVIALMLQARTCLTWRDVQHLIVYTSVRIDIDPEEWQVNGAGFAHSHKHAFGLLDSWRIVTTSKIWPSVPFMTSWRSKVMKVNAVIPSTPGINLTQYITVTETMAAEVISLEHVTVTVDIKHPVRGNLAISLISPYGTVSRLASFRKYDKSQEGFKDWTFSTVRCWGESPQGNWAIVIVDRGSNTEDGVLKAWRLTLYGSSMTQQDIAERKKLVTKAVSGRYLHLPGPPCPTPPATQPKKDIVSSRVLKLVLLLSGFFFIVSLYFILDAVCNSERKNVERSKAFEADGTLESISTDTFDFDTFIPATLTKNDEQRLSNIIEHGTARPLISSFNESLETLNYEPLVQTPDEAARVADFEERMKFALEQSLKLQMKQLVQIDDLKQDMEVIMREMSGKDFFSEKPGRKCKTRKKLKGILKKPKQWKE